jgi:L-fuculose-phosphate aldolase
MKPSERRLRVLMTRYSKAVYDRGWVANHDGNLSSRLGDDSFLITPTAVSKGDIAEDCLLVVNGKGEVQSGSRRPFSEFSLHMEIYRSRADVKAVCHAHPPSATSFAVAGRAMDNPIIAEAVVSLGSSIPLAPYSLPGSSQSLDSVRELMTYYDAILLESHGVITAGVDLEQAYLRMELVEHLAKIELGSRQLGRTQHIPEEDVLHLLKKRSGAGLGPVARGLNDPIRQHSEGGGSEALRQIVAEEISGLLKEYIGDD